MPLVYLAMFKIYLSALWCVDRIYKHHPHTYSPLKPSLILLVVAVDKNNTIMGVGLLWCRWEIVLVEHASAIVRVSSTDSSTDFRIYSDGAVPEELPESLFITYFSLVFLTSPSYSPMSSSGRVVTLEESFPYLAPYISRTVPKITIVKMFVPSPCFTEPSSPPTLHTSMFFVFSTSSLWSSCSLRVSPDL